MVWEPVFQVAMDDFESYNLVMDQPGEEKKFDREFAEFNFSRFADRLKFLHQQLVSPQNLLEDQFALYLAAGCHMLGTTSGFVVFTLGAVYKRIVVLSEDLIVHKVLDVAQQAILDEINDASDVTFGAKNHDMNVSDVTMAYNLPGCKYYLGAPLMVSGNKCGTICFMSAEKFAADSQDAETLQLMAEGVARMIELQNAQDKNRIDEIRGFATAGVKSLEEYQSMARLPDVFGVSGRVVEVLQKRIGNQQLGIDLIAEDLNLSKRTLQRRLQQQNISFAQLRDQVRFHYSIDYLTNHSLSIDAISAALDFSDRTSFTNAFKRWTSLSPSTFRKLFRDYS